VVTHVALITENPDTEEGTCLHGCGRCHEWDLKNFSQTDRTTLDCGVYAGHRAGR